MSEKTQQRPSDKRRDYEHRDDCGTGDVVCAVNRVESDAFDHADVENNQLTGSEETQQRPSDQHRGSDDCAGSVVCAVYRVESVREETASQDQEFERLGCIVDLLHFEKNESEESIKILKDVKSALKQAVQKLNKKCIHLNRLLAKSRLALNPTKKAILYLEGS